MCVSEGVCMVSCINFLLDVLRLLYEVQPDAEVGSMQQLPMLQYTLNIETLPHAEQVNKV